MTYEERVRKDKKLQMKEDAQKKRDRELRAQIEEQRDYEIQQNREYMDKKQKEQEDAYASVKQKAIERSERKKEEKYKKSIEKFAEKRANDKIKWMEKEKEIFYKRHGREWDEQKDGPLHLLAWKGRSNKALARDQAKADYARRYGTGGGGMGPSKTQNIEIRDVDINNSRQVLGGKKRPPGPPPKL